MMRKILVTIVACMVMTVVYVSESQALLTNLADEDGVGYFKMDGSDKVWADIGQFANMTWAEANAWALGKGLQVASLTDVNEFFNVNLSVYNDYQSFDAALWNDRAILWGDGYYDYVYQRNAWYSRYNVPDEVTRFYRDNKVARLYHPDYPIARSPEIGMFAYKPEEVIPEPATLMLLGVGLLGLLALRRKVSQKR